MYDVIVVGARCAGSPAAMLLARAGYRVLLVDRARFPKDTLSTLYIHQPGVALLDRWGVLPQVVGTGCPPIDKARFTLGDIRLEGCSWPAGDGLRAAYGPRRRLLDAILVESAVAAGAEFRESCSMQGLVHDDDGRVIGVRLGSAARGAAVEYAPLVIGADGMRSTVAAEAGAATEIEDPTVSCAYYSYWSDLPPQFRLYERPGGWVGTVPTNDGATLVAGYFPQERFAAIRGDALAALLDNVARTAPDLREEMAGGRQLERLYGTGDQRNFFRTAAGPGWALIGDAGHHKDSITARGITDAFIQAQLLTDRIGGLGDALRDPARLDAALERFAAERSEVLLPDYRSTLKTARLDPRPHEREMLRAVATSPELTDRYFSTLSGVCPIDEFVTPELLDLMEQQEQQEPRQQRGPQDQQDQRADAP
ncbi:NAD(P)/FAD-dependent oxidoreductase [Streptomyces armeniacus]|uniref:NAD(P)/FAD-dependent oxidoreductase n=1 Tax=Streptomyces armeniacus TaxID=83291 RepID=A0A345XPD2_9ACTN|nr:NAD(P)/FAD-dependent oxidoreductase [Streptomyces armeniacus]AXK33498.1 NAD(P)/FAD-dependent oxidoreductase [Streptomyces armeniacus]